MERPKLTGVQQARDELGNKLSWINLEDPTISGLETVPAKFLWTDKNSAGIACIIAEVPANTIDDLRANLLLLPQTSDPADSSKPVFLIENISECKTTPSTNFQDMHSPNRPGLIEIQIVPPGTPHRQNKVTVYNLAHALNTKETMWWEPETSAPDTSTTRFGILSIADNKHASLQFYEHKIEEGANLSESGQYGLKKMGEVIEIDLDNEIAEEAVQEKLLYTGIMEDPAESPNTPGQDNNTTTSREQKASYSNLRSIQDRRRVLESGLKNESDPTKRGEIKAVLEQVESRYARAAKKMEAEEGIEPDKKPGKKYPAENSEEAAAKINTHTRILDTLDEKVAKNPNDQRANKERAAIDAMWTNAWSEKDDIKNTASNPTNNQAQQKPPTTVIEPPHTKGDTTPHPNTPNQQQTTPGWTSFGSPTAGSEYARGAATNTTVPEPPVSDDDTAAHFENSSAAHNKPDWVSFGSQSSSSPQNQTSTPTGLGSNGVNIPLPPDARYQPAGSYPLPPQSTPIGEKEEVLPDDLSKITIWNTAKKIGRGLFGSFAPKKKTQLEQTQSPDSIQQTPPQPTPTRPKREHPLSAGRHNPRQQP